MVTTTRTEPLVTIRDIRPVDDAGSVHYETTWSAAFLVELVDEQLLKLENNIRPDHNGRMGTKTRRKIDKWADELLKNEAVIGNLSVRLDPTQSDYAVDEDEDGEPILEVFEGNFDCAVDSLSRIKAILKAARSPAGTFNPGTRFAVRIWLANSPLSNKVAAIYNTRGDKVNDTAAKYAWQATGLQRMARMLMQDSPHLGLDNVEVLRNNVSASSSKMIAFNTLSQAMETFWQSEPLDEDEERAQVRFLVNFWDELVKVRREFGRLSKTDRQKVRGSSLAGTAVSIHGLIAVADVLYRKELPLTSLSRLASEVSVDGRSVDYFSYDNPNWLQIGVLVMAKDKDGNDRKQLRMSFQTRSAMGKELKRKLELPTD